MKTKQSTLALIADHALLPLLLALSALCWYTLGTARYYPGSAASLLAANTKVLVIAAGCAIVTASGGIDVSIAGQISLSLTTMALASSLGAHPALVVLCGVAVGAVCGALNGLLIAVLGVPAFLATLASNFIFSGIARTLITSGISFSFKNFLSRAMDWSVLGIHLDAIIAHACLALAWFLTDRTCWGRYVLAVGLDSRAAAASGVHVRRVKWSCYFVSGLFCAVGGIVLSGNEGIAIAAADVKLTLSSLDAAFPRAGPPRARARGAARRRRAAAGALDRVARTGLVVDLYAPDALFPRAPRRGGAGRGALGALFWKKGET